MENFTTELKTTMQRIMQANGLNDVKIEVTKVKTEPTVYDITIHDEVIKRGAKTSITVTNNSVEKQEIHALAKKLVNVYVLNMGSSIHQEILDGKNNIMPFLVNEKIRTEIEAAMQNGRSDMSVLHNTICDMEVIYGIITKDEHMMPITDIALEALGIAEEQMVSIAFENIRKQGILLTPVYMDIYAQMAQQLTTKEEKNDLMKMMMEEDQKTSSRMTMVQTRTGQGGNAFIADKESLKRIRKLYGEDYYLIPTGNDGCIIMSKASEMPLEVMKTMVADMHRDIPMTKLSDHVYSYSKTSGLQIAI